MSSPSELFPLRCVGLADGSQVPAGTVSAGILGASQRMVLCLFAFLAILGCQPEQINVSLTEHERDWLRQHNDSLTVADEVNYSPFAFVNEDGISTGLATDYLHMLELKLGVTFKRIRVNNLTQILEKARVKEVDIVNAVTRTPARSEYLLFTTPFVEVPNVIIVRRDHSESRSMDDIQDTKARLSLVEDYAVTEYLKGRYPDLKADLVPDNLTALLDVSFGKTDAAVVDLATASYWTAKKGITNLRMAGDVGYPIRLSIASRKDLPELNAILEKGLAAISGKERSSIEAKWISFGQTSLFMSRRFWAFVAAILTLAVLAIGAVVAWNRALTRQVEQRTIQLRDELAERKRTEEMLRQSEHQLQLVTDTIPNILWTARPDGYVDYCNDNWLTFTGMTQEQIKGNGWTAALHPDDVETTTRLWQEACRSKTPYEVIQRLRSADGNYHWFLTRALPLRDRGGNIIRWYGSNTDITDRKRAEDDRIELQRRLFQGQKLESLGLLAGGIAHDFNNLLVAIMGNTELALEDLPAGWNARPRLENALKAARRAAALTRQMLAYSGNGTLVVEEMNLSELVRENIHFFRSSIPKSTVCILKPAPDIPCITANTSQIQQVVMNLITNASEAIGDHPGTITLATGVQSFDEAALMKSRIEEKPLPGTFVFLEVSDTGSGMSEEVQRRIFDPFFTTKPTGRGLGMSAIKDIVRSHRGAIFVSSKVGSGTTIRVLFPTSATPSQPQAVTANELAPPAARIVTARTSVLIVDDEDVVRELSSLMINRIGYKTMVAASGLEAVELYRKHADSIGCVILDLSMPGMDGRDTFLALRQIRPTVKVILSSGYGEQVLGQRFEGLALAGFIHKPFRHKQLADELNRVLGS